MKFVLQKGEKPDTGILYPTIFCDSMNQAATYWSSVPTTHIFLRDWVITRWPPSGYATDTASLLI